VTDQPVHLSSERDFETFLATVNADDSVWEAMILAPQMVAERTYDDTTARWLRWHRLAVEHGYLLRTAVPVVFTDRQLDIAIQVLERAEAAKVRTARRTTERTAA